MKAYLKIGMYQSVVPVPVPPDSANSLVFGVYRLTFLFRDSGATEDDGTPIWVAYDASLERLVHPRKEIRL